VALERSLALDPRSLRAWVSTGVLRARTDDLRGAQLAFGEAIKLEPLDAEAWFDFALACWRAGDREQARDACEHLLSIAPGEPRAERLLREMRRDPGDGAVRPGG